MGALGILLVAVVATVLVLGLAYVIGGPATRATFPGDRPLGGRFSPLWAVYRAQKNQEAIDEAIDSIGAHPHR